MRDQRRKYKSWGYIVLYENINDRLNKQNYIKFGKHYEIDVSKSHQQHSVYLTYLRETNVDDTYTYIRIYKTRCLHEVISDEEAQTRFPEYFI
jgi:hypothetical protein